jgi:hypothetical protein
MKMMVKRILNWTYNSNSIALLWFEQKTSVQNMPYINKVDFFLRLCMCLMLILIVYVHLVGNDMQLHILMLFFDDHVLHIIGTYMLTNITCPWRKITDSYIPNSRSNEICHMFISNLMFVSCPRV